MLKLLACSQTQVVLTVRAVPVSTPGNVLEYRQPAVAQANFVFLDLPTLVAIEMICMLQYHSLAALLTTTMEATTLLHYGIKEK